jgi:tetratricopeptide (TPR) repeat protein
MKIVIYAFLFALLAFPVFADEQQHHHHEANFGVVNFPISCTPEAQKQFNQAVAILHCFGYEEALHAFNAVATTDPNCGMAYWGIAMTYYHPIWAPPNAQELAKAKEAIDKAKVTGKPTDREKSYIDAIATFYQDYETVSHMDRAKKYRDAMKAVADANPSDNEASIFYALALLGTAPPNDKTYVVQKQSAEILNAILKKEPNHPGVAHYLIHSFDYPALAEVALPAARVYSKISPDSPHALHMPSHIFTRLGYWQESIDSNIASADSAVRRVQKLHPGAGSFDQLHAMDYLVYAYLQLGQDDKAKKIMDEMNTITKLDDNQFAAAYALAAVPVRYAVERGHWTEASAIADVPSWFPWNKFPHMAVIRTYGRALGAARARDVEAAKKHLSDIQALHESTVALKMPGYDWSGQVEILQQTVQAWVAFAEKKNQEAVQLMRASADLDDSTDKHPVTPGSVIPPRELLGDMLMELNQPAQALVEYEKSLTTAPNRFYALSRAAKAAKTAGDQKKAEEYYGKLLQLCTADCKRPEIAEAKSFLAKN